MRERAAALLIVGVALVAVLLARPWRRNASTAEGVVSAAIVTAKQGDIEGYLACFGGELRRQLLSARREAGVEGFARSLRERGSRITGVAVTRVGGDDPQANKCGLRVELVFRAHNEVQEYRLRRDWGSWVIVAMGPTTVVEMPVAYGTPVVPEAIGEAPARNPSPSASGP